MPIKSFRRAGRILPLSAQSTPINVLYFDVETYVKHTRDKRLIFPPRLGIAIYNKMDDTGQVKHRFIDRFTTPKQFIEITLKYLHKKEPLYVFGHNIGFDIRALGLPRLFNLLNWTSEPPIINQRMFIWTVTTQHGQIKFIDTANYAVISVEQLGHDLGYENLHINFATKDNEALFIYCQRDVEIVEKFMQDYIYFIAHNKLGKFCFTLASQAMTAWRTNFLEHDVYLHCDDTLSSYERSAYHGGRTECFFIGKLPPQQYYYLDINSMYPYVMKYRPMPVKFVGYAQLKSWDNLAHIIDKYYVIAECELDTNEPAYPVVYNGKLIFPIGQFISTLHQAELEYAYHHNHIRAIKQLALYKKAIIFSQYVDFFYGVKVRASEEHNLSWRYIAKIYLNSLYGKMGQLNPVRLHLHGEFPNDIIRSIGYNEELQSNITQLIWFGQGFYEYKHGDAYLANCAIAGAVTAYSRMLLYSYIRQGGAINCYYCDTDSIITNSTGFSNLSDAISTTLLGKLKIEDKSKAVQIWTNKDYKFGRTHKTKGMSHKAKKLAPDIWEQLQFQSFIAWMNEHGVDWPYATRITKRRRMAYNKGIVDPTTGRVTPLVLSLALQAD